MHTFVSHSILSKREKNSILRKKVSFRKTVSALFKITRAPAIVESFRNH